MYFRIRVPTNEDTLIIGQNASPLLPTAGCGSDQAMAATICIPWMITLAVARRQGCGLMKEP